MRLQNDERESSFKNILIVDDEKFILDIFSQFLGEKGFDIQTASSSNVAKEYLKSNRFDLILSDVHMKNSKFSDFLYFLKTPMSFHESIPIIAVTGVPDAIGVKERLLLSCILEKPFTPDELLVCIKQFID